MKILTLVLSATLFAQTSAADQGRGGGGAIPLRKAELASLLEGKNAPIKSKLLILSRMGQPTGLPESVKSDFNAVIGKGLVEDLKSIYKVVDSASTAEKCMANGVQVPSSSEMDKPGTEICFDVELLVRDQTTLNELVGIAFHEHAHHFGYLDANHKLAFGVSEMNRRLENQKSTGVVINKVPPSNVCKVGIVFSGQKMIPGAPANVSGALPFGASLSSVTLGKKQQISSYTSFDVPCGQETTMSWRAITRKNAQYSIGVHINNIVIATTINQSIDGRNGGLRIIDRVIWERYYDIINAQ